MPPPRYSTSTSTSYPKGSPARTTVKRSYRTPQFMGVSRSGSSTVVNGTTTQQSSGFGFNPGGSTTSSKGGGGIAGPIMIAAGAFLLWVVFRGKSGAVWDAITGNNNFSANLDAKASALAPSSSSGTKSGSSSSGGSTSSANTTDSGTHMGIDSNGNIITINSSYGSMTPEQKDAANAYAHQIGNVSG